MNLTVAVITSDAPISENVQALVCAWFLLVERIRIKKGGCVGNRAKYYCSLIREKGFLAFLGEIVGRILAWPRWVVFRLFEPCQPLACDDARTFSGRDKESILQDIICQNPGKSFLEIGIGSAPNMERARLIVEKKIRYAGCDWKLACEKYNLKLKAEGVGQDFLFFANERGNYSWTLFELMRQKKEFDIIYLDGSHTFYVDLPAAAVVHHLLRPSGYLILDDIDWSLEGLKAMLKNDFLGWYFYKGMYDLSEYAPEQQKKFHIKMIAEDLLIRQFGYQLVPELSNGSFWTLKKPLA